ncbi:MAG: hypothetical protein E6772_09200 [Dysgonomonas sp.]|nr:hypothetical protein [Dysgonomonas sp.]
MKTTKFTEITNEEMKEINGGSIWRVIGGAAVEWGVGLVLDSVHSYLTSSGTGSGIDSSMLPSSKVELPCQHTF